MFFGVNVLLMSRDPEGDRAFFRDVLALPSDDAGRGWLLFALPQAEMAIHPSASPPSTEVGGEDLAAGTVYLMWENLRKTLSALTAKQVRYTEFYEERWGTVTSIALPGGGKLGQYEPHHPLAIPSPDE